MRRAAHFLPTAALSWMLIAHPASAQDATPPLFKLGTFEQQGRMLVGLVRSDETVVDVAAALGALEKSRPSGRPVKAPLDMRDLITRYDELKERLHAIAKDPAPPKAAVLARTAVKVRPPVLDPATMLNAAVNYTEHGNEMQSRTPTPAPSAETLGSPPGLWQRRPDDTRPTPYLFLKPRSALIADGETIRIPPGRDKIDWECELVVVIGRRASHVPLEQVSDYVFGYTLENDVSDRGGRGDTRFGTDWLVGKAHDTFAPLGPFIVPKEFVADPQRLGIRLTLSGTVMQDSSTARMTHGVYELLHYASNVMTLVPGDVISTGTPSGVGAGRNPQLFMKPGDVAVCTIDGVGTLTNPVAAAEARR
jgi:2-keto-4-pentenoate hydratase/2-oxohepta-3-ene-1,7-dioic acid hydratase in catechol pathway